MKRLRTLEYVAAGMASFGLVLPLDSSAVSAGQPRMVRAQAMQMQPGPDQAPAPPGLPMISDVGLDEAGVLSGQVVDQQGAPLPQAMVTVRSRGTIMAIAKTDDSGQFSVNDLRGGTYHLTGAGGGGVFRVWTSSAAPPAAMQQATIVATEPTQAPTPEADLPPGSGPYGSQQCGPACNGPCGPSCNGYPGRCMQGCCCPVTNGQVVMTSLYAIGFGGLITGIIIATVNLREQQSGS